jgi:hypothetical protein
VQTAEVVDTFLQCCSTNCGSCGYIPAVLQYKLRKLWIYSCRDAVQTAEVMDIFLQGCSATCGSYRKSYTRDVELFCDLYGGTVMERYKIPVTL